MFKQQQVLREKIGSGESLLLQGDGSVWTDALAPFEGKAQCVYIDPPFMTGDTFTRRRFFGTKGWRTGTPYPTYPAYSDHYEDQADYARFLTALVGNAARLLKDEGLFFLHLDWRESAKARMICDQIFGEDNFLNEIIWAYESGGRARKHYSRKHDVILMYAKTRKYRFDVTRVPLSRSDTRSNHMKCQVDEDGRKYRSIRSGGKIYRYYDDEPVYPGDVWTDISHLQQRDPERTGYVTQKPLRLLERLLLPTIREGDLVCDLCCGSGTTLQAAQQLGCRFLGMDRSPEALNIARNRLLNASFMLDAPCDTTPAALDVTFIPESGLLLLGGLDAKHPSFPTPDNAMDPLESWSFGYVKDGVMTDVQHFQRTRSQPELAQMFLADPGDGVPALSTIDAAGRRRIYVWET